MFLHKGVILSLRCRIIIRIGHMVLIMRHHQNSDQSTRKQCTTEHDQQARVDSGTVAGITGCGRGTVQSFIDQRSQRIAVVRKSG